MKKVALIFCIVIFAIYGCKKDTAIKEKTFNENPLRLTLADFNGELWLMFKIK